MNRSLPTIIGAAVLLTTTGLIPVAAAAQEPELPDYTLEGVTVTTTRTETDVMDLTRKLEVITETDIERTAAEDLTDLLKRRAGVDVIQFPGLLSGVGIRGFRPEFSGINRRTLLLIDGRPAGASNLATFDMTGVERVEVLKGPASALYGSNAMGGAVNLITRRSGGTLTGRANAGYGSFDTRELAGRLGGDITERLDADVSYRRFAREENFRIGDGNLFRQMLGDDAATKLFDDGSTERVPEVGDGVLRDNSRQSHWSGSARLGYRLTDGLRADVRGELFEAADVETPGDLAAEFPGDGLKNVTRRTGDAALSAEWGAHRPTLRFFTARQADEIFNIAADEPFVSFEDETITRGLQLQNVAELGAVTLTGGVDHTDAVRENRSFSAPDAPRAPFSPNEGVRSTAAFGEGRFDLGDRLIATLGGRADRITLTLRETPLRDDIRTASETFTSVNPSAGLRYRLADGLALRGQAGRAFVTPTAFNRAGLVERGVGSGETDITLGNPELRPESSVTHDLGVELRRPGRGIDAEATLFRTDVRDRITTAAAFFPEDGRPTTVAGDEVNSVLTYVNAASAGMTGVEWRLGYDLGARTGYAYSLRLFADATHMLRAEESVTAAFVDAGRFAGREDFAASEVFGAIGFGDVTAQEIKNVADLTLNYGVEYDDLERFSARLTGRYVGERLDTDFSDFTNISDIRYPAQMTLDVVTGLRFFGRWRADFTVSNLTDENVYEVRGFNLPGRSVRLNLSVDL